MIGDTGALTVAETPVEEDRARADVYALLGVLLAKPPEAELVSLLRQAAVPDPSDDTTLAAAWATLRQAAERARTDGLNEEYQDLFIGMGRGELVPYASWYVTGFLMERPLAELRADLRRLGLERQEQVHEPEDHAAALCETMSLIIAGGAEFTFAQQREFFGKHIAPWMGRFFADLTTAQSARFYRAVGLLGERFLEVERTNFSILM